MNDTSFYLEQLETPTGRMLVVTDPSGALRAADWETHLERMWRLLRNHYGEAATLLDRSGPSSKPFRALEAYFAGDLVAIEQIETVTGGTAFQREVWNALRNIPAGETLSYGGLAARMGRDRAVRAVGAANGANPVSIVVPCHRVVGSGGSLTGYGGGIDRKGWLLAHEREHSTRS